MGRSSSWELDAHQRLQLPSSSRCSDRTAISLCRVLCRGSPRTLDHRWPLVHEHSCTCSDRSAIATGRTYEDSVTRHRNICRRRACYVKTLAIARVLSDANERARSHTCIHDEHIIAGRKGGMLSSGCCLYVACARLLLPSGRWERRPAPPGSARSPAVAQFTA